MSNGATVDRATPHAQAYSQDGRRELMRAVIRRAAEGGWLARINALHFANTYGPRGMILPAEGEAEMMRHLQEGCDK